MSLQPGTRLGPYEITAQIGTGGMGEVYRARDPRLGRDVAIKVLAPSIMADPAHLERFTREARAIAALSHPNVLAVFDVGTSDPPFLVTELLEGETLRAVIDRGPVPTSEAVSVARQIASGLSAAHGRGIVHRDLKPDNIFLTRDGIVKILDFGVVRVTHALYAEDEMTRAPLSVSGLIIGTVGYMAPEQVRGEIVDGRADLFAFGAILYEMLTGQRAFQRQSSAETLTAILHDRHRDTIGDARVPREVTRVIDRCLAKQAADRFLTATDVLAALELTSARKTGSEERSRQRSSIAVLPFVNMSADADNQYFCDGLAEDLLNALTRLPGLEVASRTSAFRFRGADTDIRQIGQDLHVATVLEGSVRRVGQRLRITAQLINVADGYHLWSERYDRDMVDVFAIQDEIVAAIVGALAPALLGSIQQRSRPTDNPQAYELYLKGRHLWHQRSPSSLQLAIKIFEQVVALDPDYALAYTGLADSFAICSAYGWFRARDAHPRVQAAVDRALMLDASLAEAQFSQAMLLFFFDANLILSETSLRAVLAINPRFVEAQCYLAMVLAAQGRADEASAALAQAHALDPLSVLVECLSAFMWCSLGDFVAMEQAAHRALALQEDSLIGRWALGVALGGQGRFLEAIPLFEQVVAVSRAPFYLGLLGCAYGCADRQEEAKRLALELDDRESRGEYIVPYARVSMGIALGDSSAVKRGLAACKDDRTPFHSVRLVCGAFLTPYLRDPETRALYESLESVHSRQ